jgi:hypothetical protein
VIGAKRRRVRVKRSLRAKSQSTPAACRRLTEADSPKEGGRVLLVQASPHDPSPRALAKRDRFESVFSRPFSRRFDPISPRSADFGPA